MMELLAPAGTPEALRAAVENGADAVYVGGTMYSARAQAGNFDLDALSQAVEYCHLRDVRVYVAVNTLIAPEELDSCCDYVRKIRDIGVDAVIVQDIGLAYRISTLFPDLEIHASTQMSLHSTFDVVAAQDLGINRVVLARELPLEEIKEIRAKGDVEVEVFVHGALCICYSGQCLMSSMIGGRSGNRGQCAQPCRLPWVVVDQDGTRSSRATAEGMYALSPKDRSLIHHVSELKGAGVDSLKIEGRMKRAEYVATVVRAYRKALDGNGDGDASVLDRIFHRGYTKAMAFGAPDATMMSTLTPKHQGLLVGSVEAVKGPRAKLFFSKAISTGDGLHIDTRSEPVGLIWGQETGTGSSKWVNIGITSYVGAKVHLTKDQQLQDCARESYRSGRHNRKIPIELRARMIAGMPLELTLSELDGLTVTVHSEKEAEPARNHSLDQERLREQLLRLGDWPVEVVALQVELDPDLMLPWSVVNRTRQTLMEAWRQQRLSEALRRSRHVLRHPVERRASRVDLPVTKVSATAQIEVVVQSLDQLKAAARHNPDRIVFYGPIWERSRPWETSILGQAIDEAEKHNVPLALGIDRIFRNGTEERYRNWLLVPGLEGVHVGSLGALQWINGIKGSFGQNWKVTVDGSLNVFNAESAAVLCDRGVHRVTLSPELTLEQLQSGFDALPPERLALVVQGSQELMVTEHCPFRPAAGGDCKGACMDKEHFLRDRKGYAFPLRFDRFCRMHIFNSRELSLLPWVRTISQTVGHIVLDGRLWSPERFGQWIPAYRHVLAGGRETEIETPIGEFTKGHLFRGVG